MATKNVTQIESNIKRDDTPASPLAAAVAALLAEPIVAAAIRKALDVAPADPWLGKDEVEQESGLKMATVCAAHRRGEVEIGYAGRSPRVRRSELARWIATKRHPLAKSPPANDAPVVDLYAASVARARGGR